MIHFTSDHHFGHYNIIQYCNRSFSSVEEMDQKLIELWNDVVKPGDIVYHLGDFCLRDAKYAHTILTQLNGRISLISNRFHHDKWMPKKDDSIVAFSKTGDPVVIKPMIFEVTYKNRIFICSHFPLYSWPKMFYDAVHLYGHVHGGSVALSRTLHMDVGVDSHEFKPVSADEILLTLFGGT